MVHHPATAERQGEGVALRITISRSSREDIGEIVPSGHEQGPFISLCEFEESRGVLCEVHPPIDREAPG